jgi:hypothetical protein
MACTDKFFVGETGSTLVVNADLDLTSATELTLVLKRPDGTTVERTLTDGDLTVGTTDYTNTVTNETYSANEYVTFVLDTEGSPDEAIIDVDGEWEGQLTYQIPGNSPPVNSPGCVFTFTVLKAFP